MNPDTQEPQVSTPVEPTPPASQPKTTPPQQIDTNSSQIHHSSAGQIVLQWLTYAFWGWTLLALSLLSLLVIQNMINRFDTTSTLPYVLAATLVLLPISFVCDLFYRKHEPLKKYGAAMVVMVIHAVIFALFGIGALIAAVFSLVQLMLASGEISPAAASIVSSLVIAILYGITFVRTLNPFNKPLLAAIYSYVMVGIAGIFIALSFFGPIAQSFMTKNDRRIEANLSTVQASIDGYVQTNNRLPANLSEVTINSPDARSIVTDQLVTYKAEGKVGPTDNSMGGAEYRYQLCVVYKQKSQYYTSASQGNERYTNYVSASDHPEGEVCYKLSSQPNNYDIY